MKILQERKPFDWTLEVECTGGSWDQSGMTPCGSILEINSYDLIKRAWFKYPDRKGVDYGFICPICGCFTEIDEKLLTEYLKGMAKDFSKVDI